MTGIEGTLVRTVRVGAFAAAVVALTASSAPAAPEPDCQNDSKSLGRIELSTADTPGTWWYLTRTGLDAAGVTDYLAAAEAAFGADGRLVHRQEHGQDAPADPEHQQAHRQQTCPRDGR